MIKLEGPCGSYCDDCNVAYLYINTVHGDMPNTTIHTVSCDHQDACARAIRLAYTKGFEAGENDNSCVSAMKENEHGYDYKRYDQECEIDLTAIPNLPKKWGERHQIIVYDTNNNVVWDVISHWGSYGYEEGLLEVMGEAYSQYVNDKRAIELTPPAQPELIEQAAYVRGFEQGRTQGMIDAQSERKKGKWIVIEAPDIYVCPFLQDGFLKEKLLRYLWG